MASFQSLRLGMRNHTLLPCEVWPVDLLPAEDPVLTFPLGSGLFCRALLPSLSVLPGLSSASVNPPKPRELPTRTLEVKPACAAA